MVDFKKLRASKPHFNVTDPIEIFRRMPKPQNINDLYTSQAEVLREWYSRWNGEKTEHRDFVIKLHTGGGKTLVGLLIAQSIMNEKQGPVIYLAPTVQLVEQILDKAKAYNISAAAYDKSTPNEFPSGFHNGKKILVCTYQALFNGHSRFGTRWKPEKIRAEGIILDDAHIAFSTVREIFTLRIEKNTQPVDYEHLISIFRKDFEELGKSGSFADIVSGKPSNDDGILEVPYWSWKQKSGQVHNYLDQQELTRSNDFVWPLLRDEFDYCHCFVSSNAFVVTPIFPLMDAIPTFYECKTRVYMSATIGDDSSLIRTFGATPSSIARPIVSNSLAGVSERMILIPELMQFSRDNTNGESINSILKNLVRTISLRSNSGVIILAPSFTLAQSWEEVAEIVASERVLACVRNLQEGKTSGPFVFANRYDGIDLAGDSCRILIMVGLPIGASEYDIYRSAIFSGVTILNYELAQRIEQGMGRGARGPNDYCVVIATGRNLVQFLSIIDNQRLLTSSTHAQIHMGLEVSNDVKNEEELKTTILTCLDRNREWQEYHADRLATLATSREMDQEQIRLANVEVKAFKQLRTHLFEEAIAGLNQFLDKTSNIDQKYRGWLKQFAARIAYYGGLQDLAQQYQVQAYLDNNNLLRPKSTLPYATIHNGSHQAKEIVEKIVSYQPYRGFLTRFEEIISMLTATSSSNQFEQSLKELGEMLGFQSQRPEKQFGVGPDVLWMLNNNTGIVMEVKSRKDPKNPLDKKEHGQLLNAEAWFKKEYPNCKCLRVSVHPNNIATKNTPADLTKVLTLQKVDDLIVSVQTLFAELCAVELPLENLIAKCDQLLLKFDLNPDSFIIKYLSSFIIE